MLGLASCTQDVETVTPVGGEVDFQLSVAAPELAGTRAGDAEGKPQNALDSSFGAIDYLQGSTDNDPLRTDWKNVDLRYTLEVYDVKNGQVVGTVPVKDRQVIIKDTYEPVVFDLRLVPKREYRFVVFADFVDNGKAALDAKAQLNVEGLHHTIGETLASITIKNDAINNEVTDAYFATKDIVIESAASQDIILKRPYGKVRVIATDLAELNLNVNPAAVEVKYTAKHPQTFNALTGEIGNWENVNYEFASVYNTISTEVDEGGLSNHFYTAGYDAEIVKNLKEEERHSHMTLFTDYILAEDQQTPINFTMTVYDKYVEKDHAENSIIKSTTFNTAIPVGRNKLTTVIGNVLTTATDINVRIDDNFSNGTEWNPEEDEYDVELISGTKTETVVLKSGKYVFDDVTIEVADGNAIEVEGDVVIDVMGVMTLDSKGGIVVKNGSLVINGVVETRGAERAGILKVETEEGSAIGGSNITIQNLAGLTAKANGKHAFGIGAENATVVIKNTKIDYVAGGHVQATLADDDTWGKKAPEGGAAIGGANITIENSEIVKAEGGSKAAAIGNKFWAATNIVIKGSTLGDIFGGNASAAIGGSRYNKENKQSINIVIEGSTITNAVGGTYGAGIGSGYDTYCATNDSNAVNKIEISTSTITAKGGKYAAGIGTGHHAAALTGSIDAASEINATSGDESYCDESGYGRLNTVAQGIGYGSVDANCEFKDVVVTFTVADKVIEAPYILVKDASLLAKALMADLKNIPIVLNEDIDLPISSLGEQTSGSGEYKLGGEATENITIDLNGKRLNITTTYWSAIGAKNNDALFTIKNGRMTSTGNSAGTWNAWDLRLSNCNYAIEDVIFEKAVALDNVGKSTSMKNVTITDNHDTDTYGLWITAEGQTVTLDGCVIDMTPASDGRGIKIDNQYVAADTEKKVTLNVANTTFKTDEKAAILVKSTAGADITLSNIDITGVAEDTSNEVWVDKDAAQYVNKVNVVGGSMIVEGQSIVPITDMETLKSELTKAGEAGAGYTVLEINADINMTGEEWTPIKVDGYHGADIVTIDGKGHTITGLNASLFAGGFAGGSGIVIKNLTIADSQMVATNTQGYGAFVNCADSMDVITLINCHLKNSSIITPNNGADESRIGGLVGWTAGYNNQNDGPVDSYITIENCSVTGCTLKGAGSVGAICGHAGANAATFTTIKNCTITNNKLISTENGSWRTGVVVGTANNGQCNISNITESGNTLTQNSASDFKNPTGATRHYYGRFVPAGTGHLVIDGVEMVAGQTYLADGLTKTDGSATYNVSNANGLVVLNGMMADKTAGKGTVVNLSADINFAGNTWTPVDSHADSSFTFAELNGNGHTISNFTINGQAMFKRFAGSGDVTVKDVTFINASVNSTTINTSILTVHTYQNVLLDNVDVRNSSINGGYKVAPLIATVYNENPATTITATLKNCDVENVTVKATSYDFCTTGMVAFVYADDNDTIEFENCTVKDVKLMAPNDSYKAHAAIYATGSDSLYNEAEGVTVTNVTFEAL